MSKNTICLWYDKDAETAARFYAATFPDSAVDAVHHAPSDYPGGKEGDVLTVEFTVLGIPCLPRHARCRDRYCTLFHQIEAVGELGCHGG